MRPLVRREQFMGKAYEDWIERKGLWLRRLAGEGPDSPLDMWAFARRLGFFILSPQEIPSLSPKTVSQLAVRAHHEWSGGALVLPNGDHVILINPNHSQARNASTIAEEIVHIKLDHKLTRLEFSSSGLLLKGYNQSKEMQAKAVAAAMLVPYKALIRATQRGVPIEQIADHFKVSTELVKFRLKVKRLWNLHDQLAGRG